MATIIKGDLLNCDAQIETYCSKLNHNLFKLKIRVSLKKFLKQVKMSGADYDTTLTDTSVSRMPIGGDDVHMLQLELYDLDFHDYLDYFPFYLSEDGVRGLLVFVNYNRKSPNYRRVLTVRMEFDSNLAPTATFEIKPYEKVIHYYKMRNEVHE